ncbi:MAG: hypothetical protein AB1752_10520 [Candidatus Zixiibacteriota bacterium]
MSIHSRSRHDAPGARTAGGHRFRRHGLVVLAMALSIVLPGRPVPASDAPRAAAQSFGKITLAYEGALPAELTRQIETAVAELTARLRTRSDLEQLASGTLTHLSSSGYRAASVRPSDFVLHDNRLDFTLTIHPGKVHRVTECLFTGLERTDTTWLRRVVALPLGVPLTDPWLADGANRIGAISYIRVAEPPEITPLDPATPDTQPVRVIWRLTETGASRFDGLLAAGGGPGDQGLTGRASIGFDGLFGRDRSAGLQYQRMQPGWHALRLEFRERGVIAAPLDWHLRVDDITQRERRQAVELGTQLHLGRARNWRLILEGRWQKIAPEREPTAPTRVLEATGGVGVAARGSGWAGERSPASLEIRSAYSRRTEWPLSGPAPARSHRLRIETHATAARDVAFGWSVGVAADTRWWPEGQGDLGPGDEWYLGGPDRMRGWEEQSVAAASGVWSSLEFTRAFNRSLSISLFGEGAWLRMIPSAGETVSLYGYGAALGLRAMERTGRLEFAWPSHGSLRDGIIRLRITQSW